MVHDYFPIDNLNLLIDSYFVQPDLVDSSVLDDDKTIQQRMGFIADSINNDHKILKEATQKINQLAEQAGVDASPTLIDTVDSISKTFTDLQTDYTKIQTEREKSESAWIEERDRLNESLNTQKQEIDRLNALPSVEPIESAALIIDGETKTSELLNSTILFDGNAYYSESFLEGYLLGDDLRYDSVSGTLVYGNEKPEKVKFSTNLIKQDYNLLYDRNCTMSLTTYNGCIRKDTKYDRSGYMILDLNKQFSKCSFKIGHKNQCELCNGSITFYGKNENGDYNNQIWQIELNPNMNPEDYEVPLNYIEDVKVVFWQDSDYRDTAGVYALTDLYFYR